MSSFIVVLTSGDLGLTVLKQLVPKYHVGAVLTDTRSEGIVAFCQEKGIACFKGNPRGGGGHQFLKDFSIDVILSVNYLFLIEMDIIDLAKKMAFNIHGSLLPKYRGRTPHVWAIINNEKVCGITAHKMDAGCDTGEKILQKEISILPTDTGFSILEKYKEAYFPLVEEVLHQIEKGEVTLEGQDHNAATYYGKRVPEDGIIDWNWSKERIYNWVRAQAHPYPSAFSFYKGEKVKIDAVSFSDHGYHYDDPNGSVIMETPKVLVKCSNGVLALEKVPDHERFNFKKGESFTN